MGSDSQKVDESHGGFDFTSFKKGGSDSRASRESQRCIDFTP